MKLLVRIRERIEIIYITIVFVSVLVGFVIPAILAHVTRALARETTVILFWLLLSDVISNSSLVVGDAIIVDVNSA